MAEGLFDDETNAELQGVPFARCGDEALPRALVGSRTLALLPRFGTVLNRERGGVTSTASWPLRAPFASRADSRSRSGRRRARNSAYFRYDPTKHAPRDHRERC